MQPCARETSAGILLPMLKIHQIDQDPIVTIFPSDHFIKEENYFMLGVQPDPDLKRIWLD